MTRKIDVSLAHRRKLCSGKKDHIAQLKYGTIMVLPIKLGMTWKIIKLPNNKVLGILNHNVDLIHYAVFSIDDNPEPEKIGISEN